MKNFLLLFSAPVLLMGCSDISSVDTAQQHTSSIDVDSMAGVECHKLTDGNLMGDCPMDEFGNLYLPGKSETHTHSDGTTETHEEEHEHASGTGEHAHEEAHEHAEGVAEDHHSEARSGSHEHDENVAPHRD
jgi:hypothetical protein